MRPGAVRATKKTARRTKLPGGAGASRPRPAVAARSVDLLPLGLVQVRDHIGLAPEPIQVRGAAGQGVRGRVIDHARGVELVEPAEDAHVAELVDPWGVGEGGL